MEPIQDDPIRDAIEQTSNERTYHAAIAAYDALQETLQRTVAEKDATVFTLVAERDRLLAGIAALVEKLNDTEAIGDGRVLSREAVATKALLVAIRERLEALVKTTEEVK